MHRLVNSLRVAFVDHHTLVSRAGTSTPTWTPARAAWFNHVPSLRRLRAVTGCLTPGQATRGLRGVAPFGGPHVALSLQGHVWSEARMSAELDSGHDDRVLAATRAIAAVIIPFLVAGFVLLYLFPSDTKALFAWTITPTMTPMFLASAYLGGAYFFLRVLREPRWNVVKTGLVAVALFAGLLGVATIIHWDRFNHHHPAFWVWATLYFTTPFLVAGGWLANRRFASRPGTDEVRLGPGPRWTMGLVGLLALIQGAVMFVAPTPIIAAWPWTLTPLTCRVVGAVFCLGSAGAAVLIDPRWTSVKLMLQVEMLMISLMLIAAARAHTQFATNRPLTWLLLAGFIGVLAGSTYLWRTYEHPRLPRT